MAGGANRRTERLLTLVFVLLGSRRGVTRDQLRRSIPDYADSPNDAAFERMFERDKESLRDLGVPVETVQLDAFHDDEWAYTIDPRAYELPPMSFTTDELVALGLAGRAWRQAALEGEAAAALRKLESIGIELPEAPGVPVEPRLGASEPAFPSLLRAATERRPVEFDYRKPGGEPELRHVQPWGLVLRLGSTYLVGHDSDRGERRVFKVSRVEGEVRMGRPDAFTPPTDLDLRTAVRDGLPETVAGTARLRVAPGRAMSLRHQVGVGPDEEVLELPFRSLDQLEREVAGHGVDVLVLDPPELRVAVIRRLRGVLAP